MAENTELMENEVVTVDVGDKNNQNKCMKIVSSPNTTMTQASQPAESGVKSPMKTGSTTPTPASCKRSRSPGCGSISSSQNVGPPKFARSCMKCGAIRSSLKLEMANLKKANSCELKKLREQIKSLNQEKGDLRNSVNFLQKMYSNLLGENENLKKKRELEEDYYVFIINYSLRTFFVF